MSELPLPTFAPDEKVCGNCKLWSPHSTDHRGWVGPCRLQAQRGLFPPSAPVCDAFAPRGGVTVVPAVKEERQRRVKNVAPVIVRHGEAGVTTTIRPPPLAAKQSAHDPNEQVDLEGLSMTRQELMEIFREAAGVDEAPPLAGKWEGGVIQMIPGKTDLQAKELPIDSLFHKIVMARDRLRVLEQKINAHPKLSDAEKVEMQSYITRIYGSFTSFNVLFRDKEDHFVGSKTDE